MAGRLPVKRKGTSERRAPLAPFEYTGQVYPMNGPDSTSEAIARAEGGNQENEYEYEYEYEQDAS
jgi:hypothetical protein